jgi:hypothetical protein
LERNLKPYERKANTFPRSLKALVSNKDLSARVSAGMVHGAKPFADVTNPYPHVTEAYPHVTRAYPHVTRAYPQVTRAYPQVTRAYPPVTRAYPQVTRAYPPVTRAYPPVTRAYPQVTRAYPPVTETYPRVTEAYARVTEASPPVRETFPPGTGTSLCFTESMISSDTGEGAARHAFDPPARKTRWQLLLIASPAKGLPPLLSRGASGKFSLAAATGRESRGGASAIAAP